MNVLLPALTCLLGFVSAATLTMRFWRRRQAQYGVWTLGLVWYAVAAGCEALGATRGWDPLLYRTWYITGAIGVAAYLGAGTIYLHRSDTAFASLTVVCVLVGCIPALATRHAISGAIGLLIATLLTIALSVKRDGFPHLAFAALVITSVLATLTISGAPVDVTLLPRSADEIVSGQAFDPEVRALTPAFNIAGAAVLVLGAALSAIRFARTRAAPQRTVANALIAVGAFIPSLASGLTRFGITSLFFVGELLGLVCIVAGFVLSTRRPLP